MAFYVSNSSGNKFIKEDFFYSTIAYYAVTESFEKRQKFYEEWEANLVVSYANFWFPEDKWELREDKKKEERL